MTGSTSVDTGSVNRGVCVSLNSIDSATGACDPTVEVT